MTRRIPGPARAVAVIALLYLFLGGIKLLEAGITEKRFYGLAFLSGQPPVGGVVCGSPCHGAGAVFVGHHLDDCCARRKQRVERRSRRADDHGGQHRDDSNEHSGIAWSRSPI